MKLVGISGSLTPRSRTTALVALALEYAATHCGVATELLDLRQVREFCDGRPFTDYAPATQRAVLAVEGADALIVGTPIYRGSYTGALKNLFDLVRNEPMRGKIVGFIATGGSDHHFLAVEHHLRPLFSFFGAHTVPGFVYAHNAHFDGDTLTDPSVQAGLERLVNDVITLCDRLAGELTGPAYPKIQRKSGEG
ncbi:MAG TPA: NADPH-dependent FMN reductase [Bacillota bacterium]